jgi:hypothetical protein
MYLPQVAKQKNRGSIATVQARDPDIVLRLTQQLADRGVPEPRQVAIERLTGYGILDEAGALTPYGASRDRMTAEERAIDRASSRSGRPWQDYVYDPATNRATLRRNGVRHGPHR